jgi:hypothetical protein
VTEPLVVPDGQIEYDLYPHQYRAQELASLFPIFVLSGGVRNGKTRAAICWCMSRSGWGPFGKLPPPDKPRIGWIVVPTITPMWEHVRPEWEMMWGFKDSGGLIIDQKLAPQHSYTVMCPDGGEMVWYVKSAEHPDRLRAASIWAAWLTEAAMNEEAVYSIVQQRVIAAGGSLFMESSSFGINWFVKRVKRRASHYEDWSPTKRGGIPRVVKDDTLDKRIAVIHGVPIEANESIDREAIAGIRADASTEEARREYDGEDFAYSGLIWKAFDPDKHVLKHHPTEDDLDGAEILAGMDFGWEHPFAHLWVARKGKTYLVLDEYRESARVLKDHAAALHRSEYNSFVTWRYRDPSGVQAAAEMTDYKIGSTNADNDVDLGCNAVAQAFESGNLIISPRCEKLIDEIGGFHRDEKTGKIVKIKDDLCDCLRYIIYSDKLSGGPMNLPHYSPDPVSGHMKLQSDDPELLESLGADDTIPLADGIGGVEDDSSGEII